MYTPTKAIKVFDVSENHLREIDTLFSDGQTVETGVSGYCESSQVIDTFHREAFNKFSEDFSAVASPRELVKVKGIDVLTPVVSLYQNSLNRNSNSNLVVASVLPPLSSFQSSALK